MSGFDPRVHVDAVLDVGRLDHAELSKRVQHNGHADAALAALLRQPDVHHGHVADHLDRLVHSGVLTPVEAKHMHGALHSNPAGLRPALERIHAGVRHAGAALQAEQGARLWGAAPGASRNRSGGR